MKELGSKYIETERLELRPQTMEEQFYLWKVLMIPEVNRYFLTAPQRIKEKLQDWNIQKPFYEEKVNHANDLDNFEWSVFLKETDTCIGRVTCQEGISKDVRDVGWIFDPIYQGKGYATEAAKAMLNYMFNECNIEAIKTSAAIVNPKSYNIMEKLGFERQEEIKMKQYTFVDELIEAYTYYCDKEMFNKKLKKNTR